MKDKILKIAGVKSEKEFYKKYPSEEAFMKAHGKEFRKAKIGDAIPKNQNAQFTLPNARDLARANMPAAESTGRTVKTVTGPVSTSTVGQSKENVAASTKAMANVRKKEFAEKKKQQEAQEAARESRKNNQPFTLPNGQTKQYDDMTASEQAYITGLIAKDMFEIDYLKDPSGGVSFNDFNPLDFVLGEMAGNLGTSIYEGVEQGSMRPVLGAVADPVLAGAIAGAFSPGTGGSKLLKKELDPIKAIKKATSLITAAELGERQFAKEFLKQGSKEASKKAKDVIVDQVAHPSLVDANTISPETKVSQLLVPKSVTSTKEFKKGGNAVHKLQNADRWVQRAANAEFECKSNPRTQLRQSYTETSNPSGQMDKEELKQLKKEYNASPYRDSVNINEYFVAKQMAENRNRKMRRDDQAYSKYYDPTTGMPLPSAGLALSQEGNLSAVNRMFPGTNILTPGDILQGIKNDYNMTAPMNKKEMKETMEKAYKVGYQKPKAEKGRQVNKFEQLTDFGNPPIAQIGAYIGGGAPNTMSGMMNLGDIYSGYDKAVTGLTDAERADMAYKQAQAQKQQTQGGGGPDISGMLNQLGGMMGGAKGDNVDIDVAKTNMGGMSIGTSIGRTGKNIRKAQNGINDCGEGQVWDESMQMCVQDTGYQETSKFKLNPNLSTGTPQTGPGTGVNPSLATTANAKGKGKGPDFGKAFGLAGRLYEGFRNLKEEKRQRKLAESTAKISDLTLQAASSRPEEIKRRYVRPEDALVQPNQLSPSYGVGTNYLAKDGTTISQIGGNPTEIQNMYNPGNLYSDLGYEPMSESDIIKQYRHGGYHRLAGGGGVPWDMIGQLGSGIGSAATGDNAGGDVGGDIGGAVGEVAGNIIAPGVGGAAGKAIGQTLGTITGGLLDKNKRKMEAAQKRTRENLEKAAFASGAQAVQARNNMYMEEGGWVSHDWQPQVIAKFGEYDINDLLKRDSMMDTLRTGGRITQNNMFPTDQYALGGELKTTWGGYAEPISYNPYMPGTGETVMFRGKSHEEGDGNGHTGIGVKYGDGGMTDYAEYGSRDADADVEVERGEPATEMLDPQTGEKNMVVFGNLQIPNHFLDQIGDKNAKGKKFKNYVADLGKDEAKQNKIVEKATNELDALEVYTPFDKLKFDALQATIQGANMKLKEAALRKSNASAVQNAINEAAEERGIDADALAKGKYKIDKEAMKEQAKYGTHIPQADKGKRTVKGGEPKMETLPSGELKFTYPDKSYYIVHKDKSRTHYDKTGKVTEDLKRFGKAPLDKKVTIIPAAPSEVPMEPIENTFDENLYKVPPKKRFDWMPYANQALEYLRPTDQEAFDFSQVYPEMAALAMNQLEPVQAQLYRPDLGTPMDISLQDQMNANQADFNAIQRQMGYNPEALSALAAQKYAANSKVLGDQFRLNQAEKQRVYEGNRALLNDAQLKNLGILDTQMVRQEQAKSTTKQQALEAMKSVADKIAKNKLENKTLGIYENMYKYRFDASGRALNMNPLAQFDYSGAGASSKGGSGGLASGLEFTYDANGNIVGTRKSKAEESKNGKKVTKNNKNGNIVRAIKNL